jgi:hypothetical protein
MKTLSFGVVQESDPETFVIIEMDGGGLPTQIALASECELRDSFNRAPLADVDALIREARQHPIEMPDFTEHRLMVSALSISTC